MEPSMKITEIKPYAVIERFPEHEETIKQLFQNELVEWRDNQKLQK